jgi:hypothetical protein
MRSCSVLAGIALAIIFVGCQKEFSNSNPAVPVKLKYTSLEDFFQTNIADTQFFNFKNSIGGICKGKKGTKFHFPAFCFGNGLSDDSINIEIIEIFTPYDMIMNNKPTMSDGKPLLSGGEFHIKASLKGKEIKLDVGKYLRIEADGIDVSSGMSVFNGTTISNGTVNWTLNTNQSNRVRPRDSVGLNKGYDLFCDSLKWINCDRFINEQLIKCSFTPVNCPSVDSTAIFIHLTGRNSILRVSEFDNTNFYSSRLIATPATAVGICYKNNKLYAAITQVFLSDNLVTPLSFVEINEDDLKNKLKALK